MNKKLIIEKLTKYNYPEQMYASMVSKIEALGSNLSYDFERWVEDGSIPTTQYEGYTFESLTQEYEFNPINAFIILDWLRRDPEPAKTAIENGAK